MRTFLRYLAAAPVILASLVGVPTGYHMLQKYLFAKGRDRGFDLGAELVTYFKEITSFWPTPLAVVLFVVLWRTTSAWPKIALVPSAVVAVSGLLTAGFGGWQRTTAAVAAPVAAVALAWLAGRIVSWPLTGDVRRGPAEIVVKLRGGGRLRVQSRRLLLDKLPPPIHPSAQIARVAIRFDRLRLVEAGVVHTPAVWRLANTSELVLSPGPVLRIIGAGQEWLLPVDDTAEVRRLVTERATARAKADPRPPLESGRWSLAKPLWELAGVEPPQRNTQKVKAGGYHWLLVLSAVVAPMALYSVYRIFTDSWGFLIGVLFFGGIAYGTARGWFSVHASQRLAEENPTPPMADDPDPRRIPVSGWSATPVAHHA